MAPVSRPCTGVLLAAGAGTRLGCGPKALLSFRGVPLVSHLAQEMYDGGCHRVVVVLGCSAPLVRSRVPLKPFEVVVNADWESGMGSSFRTGVSAALAGASADDDVMVTLVDQPGVSAAMIKRLLEEHRILLEKHRDPAAAGSQADPGTIMVTAAGFPSSSGALVRGHPVLFPASSARGAAALASGDSGARAFLRQNPGSVSLVDCGDLGNGRDIDVEADLALLGPP